MAQVIVTLKVMPTSPEVNLERLKVSITEIVESFVGKTDIRVVEEPIAFGLTALMVTFIADEQKGSTDPLEQKIAEIEDVNSVEATDVRRAVG